MSDIITVGLDLAMNVFQVYGADASGRAVLRKRLRRAQVLEFFSQLPSCVVAMEACGGAHFWGREISGLGHEVKLIPPAYVKPFVKRQKNDAADAEAICEAAQRPTMRFVPVSLRSPPPSDSSTVVGVYLKAYRRALFRPRRALSPSCHRPESSPSCPQFHKIGLTRLPSTQVGHLEFSAIFRRGLRWWRASEQIKFAHGMQEVRGSIPLGSTNFFKFNMIAEY